MRKLTFVLTVGLALLALSCQKEAELPDGGPATFGISSIGDTNFPKLAKNGSQKVTFCATTEDDGVKEQLTATFKVGDASLVDIYNATAPEELQGEMIPLDAYVFTANDVTIDRYNRNSRTASLTVTNTPTMEEKVYVLPVQIEKVEGSANASVDANDVIFFTFYALGLDKGKGTKAEPYLIYDVDDMMRIREQCVELTSDQTSSLEKATSATPTYFKMMEDIDLAGISWIPYNYDNGYRRKIDFNGNHKTISNLTAATENTYASLFGVLFGECYDLNVVNAHVISNQTAGILCGYLGTGNNAGTIHNCSVQGKVESNNSPTGGLVGQIGCGCEIYECYVDAEVVETANKNFVGGLIGYEKVNGCRIHDCIVMGTVTGFDDGNGGGTQRIGGVIGMLYKEQSSIVNCIALNTLKGARCIGGIVGHANIDKWDERHPNQTVKGCIAWNAEIISGQITESGASNGAIVGFGSEFNTYENCVRKADLKYTYPAPGFAEGANNPDGRFNTFFDQANSSDSSPLELVIHDDSNKLYRAPYNGVAAPAGATASQVAKTLGWDENIWTLTGDIPVLKNVYAK